MSSLTPITKIVYVPVLYDKNNTYIQEGSDHYCECDAENEAMNMVSKYVEKHYMWCFARVEKRVIPTYI